MGLNWRATLAEKNGMYLRILQVCRGQRRLVVRLLQNHFVEFGVDGRVGLGLLRTKLLILGLLLMLLLMQQLPLVHL